MTPAGIEPATFRFVAQHLNHCATAVYNFIISTSMKFKRKELGVRFVQQAAYLRL